MPDDQTSIGANPELELYRAIVASMLEGVAVIRQSDARIEWANNRLTTLMGRPAGGLSEEPASKILGPGADSDDAGPRAIIEALTSMGVWDGMLVLPSATGPALHCRSAISTFSHPEHGAVWLAMLSPLGEATDAATPVAMPQTDRKGITLPGRGTFQDDLTRELSRARRTKEPVSVAMLSLDGALDFGRTETIDLLAGATQSWRGTLRDSDSISYYDFGEFDYVVLLPDCPADEAQMVTERTRAATPGPVTCSAGFATWDNEESGLELAVRAHRALKSAQRAGGDRSARAAGEVGTNGAGDNDATSAGS